MSTTPYGHERDDDEREREQVRYRRALTVLRLLQGAFAISVLTLVAAALFVVLQVRGTQLEGTPLGKKLLEQAETIKSCTSTDGECAKRNRKQTADLVADINRISIIAAACADQPAQQTVEQIQSCVIAKLAAEDRRQP